jgi:hypothetical protein
LNPDFLFRSSSRRISASGSSGWISGFTSAGVFVGAAVYLLTSGVVTDDAATVSVLLPNRF